jgi:hypothetical protein
VPAKPRTNRKTAPQQKSSVLRLDRQENVDAIAAMIADREPLFSIGGEVYTIPKKAPAAWTLQATQLGITESAQAAAEYAFDAMLGEDGYKALVGCPTLTMTDLEIVRDAILGRVIPGPAA